MLSNTYIFEHFLRSCLIYSFVRSSEIANCLLSPLIHSFVLGGNNWFLDVIFSFFYSFNDAYDRFIVRIMSLIDMKN